MCKAGFVCEVGIGGILNWKWEVELLTSCLDLYYSKLSFYPEKDIFSEDGSVED